ncbi:PREDICTED: coiled-coil domain-containing protein 137-like [Amphimedon queenslandica]|uniref:Uncharacterized protein n=1 Tax=Amphimedon queenslandica TaxID=400682 RepID=A0A1X7VSM2_AMPQE|nr:PREDICTED: coiled-coil domain-containing protein 137-like [Amphimedon queenslandica]|eukprot:XP_003382774.1 PREDICTED: coiled-coil domain-containing protein 137-like [Amphimedon queenslandica]
MGRVRKVKSCDPFYKGPKKDLDKGFNLPPKKGEKSQSLSRSFRDFLLYSQPPKKREIPSNEDEKESKNVKTGDGKQSKRRKVIEKIESPRDDDKEDEDPLKYKRMAGEGTEQYLLRINEEANKRLISAHKKVASTSTKRKEYLKRRKLKSQLRKKGIRIDDTEGLDFEDLQDCIKFGEVAKAPPSLTPAPKNKKKKAATKVAIPLKKQKDIQEEREKAISIYRQAKKRTNRTISK